MTFPTVFRLSRPIFASTYQPFLSPVNGRPSHCFCVEFTLLPPCAKERSWIRSWRRLWACRLKNFQPAAHGNARFHSFYGIFSWKKSSASGVWSHAQLIQKSCFGDGLSPFLVPGF